MRGGEMKSGVRVEWCEEAFFILPFCFVTFILGKQNKSKDGLSHQQSLYLYKNKLDHNL
jgi:hypothetical protein